MKKSAALMLVASILWINFASVAVAADNNTVSNTVFAKDDAVGIYGPVYNGPNLTEIIARQGSNYAITMDGNNFAAFNYDLKNNVTTESLSIEGIPGTSGRVIGEHRLVYTTKVLQTTYRHTSYNLNDNDWSTYPALDLFGERYVLLKSKDVNKIAKLIIDNDLKYVLTPGEKLDLGQGYSLQYRHAYDKGKVLLEFDKDGGFVANAEVELYSDSSTWTCKLNNIQGEYDVPVLKVHVNPVFDSNPAGKAVLVQGLWLIDFANSLTINNDYKLGKLNDISVNGSILTISNKEAINLTRDSIQEIGPGLHLKTADSEELRFYVFKKYSDPGTYEIRGQVLSGLQTFTWNASNFAGFYYDPDNNVSTESLSITGINERTIPENGLRYNSTIKNIEYKYTSKDPDAADWGSYPAIGLFGNKYVPLRSDNVSKIAKVVIDNSNKYTITSDEKLDLGKGYSLRYKQVGDDDKVLLELDKDGKRVDDTVLRLYSENRTWTCKLNNIQGANDVPVLKVHVNPVFGSSPIGNFVQIEGIWLIDYANFLTINKNDSLGQFNVNFNGPTLTFSNKDEVNLIRDSDQEIGYGLCLRVADSEELRFYPYFQKNSDDANNIISLSRNLTTPEMGVDENYTVTGKETPVENNTTIEKKPVSGFGIFLAIFGLFAVVYLQYFRNQ